MAAQQLDLFGAPLRPPQKIRVDDAPAQKKAAAKTVQPEPELPKPQPLPEATVLQTEPEEQWPPVEYEQQQTTELSTAIVKEEMPMQEQEPALATHSAVSLPEEAIINNKEANDNEPAWEEQEEAVYVKHPEKKATTEVALQQRGRKPIQEYDEEADNLNIPPDEDLFKRQYYSMRETAAMFNVNQSLLRFWENEFDILQPKKNKKGDRYFRPVDVKNLVLIYHLLRVRKFTMEGAKEYLQSNKKAGDAFDMVKKLERLKTFLLELKASL